MASVTDICNSVNVTDICNSVKQKAPTAGKIAGLPWRQTITTVQYLANGLFFPGACLMDKYIKKHTFDVCLTS